MTPTSSGQLLRPRHPRHRVGASGFPSVWSFVAVRVPLRTSGRAGCAPGPRHLRPKPSLTRVQLASGEPVATWGIRSASGKPATARFSRLPYGRTVESSRPAPLRQAGWDSVPALVPAGPTPERKQG
jgi:hypothetical protein